jgi:translocation and assembly module TamA
MTRGCSALKTLNNRSYYFIPLLLGSVFFFPSCYAKESQNADFIIVSISGVDKKTEDNIRKNLTLNKLQSNENIDASQIKLLTERGKAEIQAALHPFGYYHAKLFSNLSPNGQNHWFVHYHIIVGQPVTLSKVNINMIGDGSHNSEILNALKQFPLKPNDVLNQEVYTHSKNDLLTTAIHEGYLDAYFSTHEILVDLDKNQADIHLELNTLKAYTIGHIHFSGSNFNEAFLKRFAKFYENEPYSPEKVLSFQRALQQSDYFKSAQVEPNPDPNNRQVPLDVTLDPLRPNKYTIGLGYGTDTGIRGTLGWERRYLNQWGHRFLMNFRAGQKNNANELNVGYVIPGKFPITDNYRLKAGLHNEDYLDSYSRVQEVGVSQNRQLGDWQRVLTLAYRQEQFQQYDTSLERDENLLLPSVQFIKIVSDDLFSPNIGHRFTFNVKAAIGTLLSDTSFFQPKIEYKYLRKFTPDTKFIFRTELGMTVPDDINRIPLSQRFYAGGDQSIRGFGYRALPGNLDKHGQERAIGGGYLAIGSLELEQKVYGPLSLALFSDAGNAFHRSNDRVQVSMGGGLRVNTPIGPIKVDLARPLTDDQHHWRIHLQVGPEL